MEPPIRGNRAPLYRYSGHTEGFYVLIVFEHKEEEAAPRPESVRKAMMR